MKKIGIYILVLMVTMSTVACKSSKKRSTRKKTRTHISKPRKSKRSLVRFEQSKTLSSVLDKAAKYKKPVFVDFYTSWCMPCKMMDKNVFSDKQTSSYLNRNFINYKVNCETSNGANLAGVFNIGAYPTLLFLDDKGNVLERHDGVAYYSKLKKMGNRAIRKYKAKNK